MTRFYRSGVFVVTASLAAGCSGASGGGPETPPVARPVSDSASVRVGSTSVTPVVLAGGVTAFVDFPATSSGAATMTLEGSSALPSGEPSITATFVDPSSPGSIIPPNTNGTAPVPVALAYLTLTAEAKVAFAALPVFSFALPANAPSTGVSYYLGYYDPTDSYWDLGLSGPSPVAAVTIAGSTGSVAFSSINPPQFAIGTTPPVGEAPDPLTYVAGRTYGFVLYSVTTST